VYKVYTAARERKKMKSADIDAINVLKEYVILKQSILVPCLLVKNQLVNRNFGSGKSGKFWPTQYMVNIAQPIIF